MVVVVDNQLDQMQAPQGVALFPLLCQLVQDLDDIVVVLLQVENSEAVLGYLLQDSVDFLLYYAVFLLFEAVADDGEDDLPASFQGRVVVADEIVETADHQLFYCEGLRSRKDILKGSQVLLLEGCQLLLLQEFGDDLFQKV